MFGLAVSNLQTQFNSIRRHVKFEQSILLSNQQKRVHEDIDAMVTLSCEGIKLNDANLKEQLDELLHEIQSMADLRNCIVDDKSAKN